MSEKGRDNDGRTTGQSEKEIGEPIRREGDVRRRERRRVEEEETSYRVRKARRKL